MGRLAPPPIPESGEPHERCASPASSRRSAAGSMPYPLGGPSSSPGVGPPARTAARRPCGEMGQTLHAAHASRSARAFLESRNTARSLFEIPAQPALRSARHRCCTTPSNTSSGEPRRDRPARDTTRRRAPEALRRIARAGTGTTAPGPPGARPRPGDLAGTRTRAAERRGYAAHTALDGARGLDEPPAAATAWCLAAGERTRRPPPRKPRFHRPSGSCRASSRTASSAGSRWCIRSSRRGARQVAYPPPPAP